MSNCLEIFYVSDTKIMCEEELKKSFEKYKAGDLKTRYNIIKSNIIKSVYPAAEMMSSLRSPSAL